MKKCILFLINGFGIEQPGSYIMKMDELIPNINKLSSERIFASLQNHYSNYKDAYRNFSMNIDAVLTHTLMDRNVNTVEYAQNKLMKYIENEANKRESNIHVFVYWESDKIVDDLEAYITDLEENTKGKIFLHFVLCQTSLYDYPSLSEGLTRLLYKFGQRVKIGIVTGQENFNELLPFKEIMKAFLTDTGEKWKDISKKIEVFTQTKMIPSKARTFAVNYGCRIEEKDQILFFNYSSIDINNFRKELFEQKYRPFDASTIMMYSLFPVKCEEKIPFMYNYAISSTCFVNSLKNAGLKCLVMDTKEHCSVINYYFTGLKNDISEEVKYLSTEDGFIYDSSRIIENIKTFDKDLYIINYELDSSKNMEEFEDRLKKIDKVVGELHTYTNDNNYSLFITSLYGMDVELYTSKAELRKINYYSKVPLIISDNNLSLSQYNIIPGSLYDIANSLIFSLNSDYKDSGIIKKKSKLFSFLYKKPKKVDKPVVRTVNGGVDENKESNVDNQTGGVKNE